MDQLKASLLKLVDRLDHKEEIKNRLDNLVSIYPFNEYELMMSALLAEGILNFEDYLTMRDEYISRNLYLNVFEISAPRGFGEKWAQGHLKEMVPELVKPTKKLDSNYSGQYDFWIDGITIEVKASRAVDANSREPLYMKALSSTCTKPFLMNFQQIKPACCDVFVWIAVWRDVIRYWVLSSHEVESNRFYSTGQHRGNTGEGQLHMTHDNIDHFKPYEVKAPELLEAIKAAYKRQISK